VEKTSELPAEGDPNLCASNKSKMLKTSLEQTRSSSFSVTHLILSKANYRPPFPISTLMPAWRFNSKKTLPEQHGATRSRGRFKYGEEARKMDSEASVDTKEAPKESPPQRARKGPKFWIIMCVIALTGLLPALEATVTSTVLAVIVAELGGGDNYLWVANAYFLTM